MYAPAYVRIAATAVVYSTADLVGWNVPVLIDAIVKSVEPSNLRTNLYRVLRNDTYKKKYIYMCIIPKHVVRFEMFCKKNKNKMLQGGQYIIDAAVLLRKQWHLTAVVIIYCY